MSALDEFNAAIEEPTEVDAPQADVASDEPRGEAMSDLSSLLSDTPTFEALDREVEIAFVPKANTPLLANLSSKLGESQICSTTLKRSTIAVGDTRPWATSARRPMS